ncbi:MAG TPA: hypothetical protein VF177_13905 [Anaerolineae bacterium]
MTSKLLANYEEEQALFTGLVESDDEPNILLFQGESGSGKSHFIAYCLDSALEMPSLLVKLQAGGDSVPALFTSMGGRRGWQNLPRLTHTVATLLEAPGKVDDPLWQMGMHRHLREIGKIGDLESRLTRYQLLSDAWFADSLHFEAPFLLAVDAYENASTVFDRWFSQDFLVGVANSRRMRVVVAGQRVPAVQADWSFCASLQELAGIHEAEEWLAWAEAAGYQAPSLEVMAGVVLALKGNPSQIVEVIQTQFPRRSGPIRSKESLFEQRRRFFNNMTWAFSLNELKNICFFLGIEYENLPDHDQKDGFVRELLAYAGRIGRLKELVQVLQAERPHLAW